MRKQPLCFMSYAHGDSRRITAYIRPLLDELGIELWKPNLEEDFSNSFFDRMVEGIRQSDFVLVILNHYYSFVDFELGAAIGCNKPIIAVALEKSEIHDFSILSGRSKYITFYYLATKDEKESQIGLRKLIANVVESIIDKSTFADNPTKKLVGISVGTGSDDFGGQLAFTIAFIDFIKLLTNNPEIGLIQTSKGSLKSIISLDLKSWAELLEKVLFFIPELKKRKLDRLKVEAEIKKTDAETNKINIETKILQAQAFLDIAERYQELGFNIQIDDDLLITQDQDGRLTFKQPPRIE